RGHDRGVQFFLYRHLLDARGAVRRPYRHPNRAADRSDGTPGMRWPSFRLLAFAAVVLAALIAPHIFAGSVAQNLAILSLLYAVVASNWDLTLGYAGIFNFAHVAFFGIASYVSAIATVQF